MDRENKVIKTANHNVVIKTYLTAGERRAIRGVVLSKLKIDFDEDTPNIKDFTPEVVDLSENKTIETVIISIDDKTEDIVTRFLDFKVEEYDEVMKEVSKVAGGTDDSLKKN
jgi:hypothetical protein